MCSDFKNEMDAQPVNDEQWLLYKKHSMNDIQFVPNNNHRRVA